MTGKSAINRPLGFTLIELMITVVIIGILAGIAHPSYRHYMVQTRRSDAQIVLMRTAALQEKYFSDCGHYAAKLEGISTSRTCGTAADFSDGVLAMNGSAGTTILSDNRDYMITLVKPTASGGACAISTCFFLQATPSTAADIDGSGNKGTARQVGDGRLRISSTGSRSWDKKNANAPNDSTPGDYVYKWTDR